MSKNIKNVMAVIDYIENHLSDKLDLETVANAMNYSKFHLHRMFTEMVGLTIHEYIQRRQLTEAAKLLVFSDKPIIEIALIAGYKSQQAFTAVFKSMYKKTPNQYREKEEFYPLQLRYVLNENPTKSEGSFPWQEAIDLAVCEDIPMWMDLVRLVIDGFPNLNERDYLEQLGEYIRQKRALILKDKDIAIGIMAFHEERGSIDFLGIHPQYRKLGITRAFLMKALSRLSDPNMDIAVTTFREGDKADTGYRNTFKKLGFAEAELLTEFGYPTQRFILQKEHLEKTQNGRSTNDRKSSLTKF